jgi:tRNA(Leu) C34 or U34 (ribose-2'-O)-methylase TrmL
MQMQIEEVMLVIPFSRNVRTANLTVTVGTILFDESSKVRKKKNTHTNTHTQTEAIYLFS